MPKPVKLDDSDHANLVTLAQTYKMNMNVIVGYLIDMCSKYDLLDPDWIEPILEERIKDFLSSHDADLAKKLQIERTRTINSAKLTAFKKYIDVLEPEARKDFLENILGNVNDESFLDNISNYAMFTIDGTPRLYPIHEGKPVIAGVTLVACMTGYHIAGNYCKNCRKWRDCEFRKEEYQSYLSRIGSDTTPENRRIVESQSTINRRKELLKKRRSVDNR
jgi:hypothetical protein